MVSAVFTYSRVRNHHRIKVDLLDLVHIGQTLISTWFGDEDSMHFPTQKWIAHPVISRRSGGFGRWPVGIFLTVLFGLIQSVTGIIQVVNS